MSDAVVPPRSRVRRRPGLSVLVAIAAVGLLLNVAGAAGVDRLPASLGHALSHLFVAAPLAWLLTAMARSWPPARQVPPGRLARRMALIGLAGVVTGQALEVLGARVDEPAASEVEQVAHTAGLVVTNLSMLCVVLGGVLALVAATRDRALPRWVATIVAVVVVAGFAAMVVGEPGT